MDEILSLGILTEETEQQPPEDNDPLKLIRFYGGRKINN